MREFLVKMGHIDRRVIFLLIALAVIVPLILRTVFPVVTTPIVQNIFDKIESLLSRMNICQQRQQSYRRWVSGDSRRIGFLQTL